MSDPEEFSRWNPEYAPSNDGPYHTKEELKLMWCTYYYPDTWSEPGDVCGKDVPCREHGTAFADVYPGFEKDWEFLHEGDDE